MLPRIALEDDAPRFMAEQTDIRDHALLDHRLIIVAGKGGVGKSTVAMAIALALARAGRRTLLYQYSAMVRSVTPLGPAKVGEEIVRVRPNLYAVRPSTASGMREYVRMRLKSRTAYKVVFENDFVSKLLDGIPGVTELIWLGKAFNHEREVDESGRKKWDAIVLDPPATGHSLYLFQVPFVIRDAVPSGPFHRDATQMVELLQDRERTALHLVTLPEEMPVNEVIDLEREVRERMQLPVVSMIANSVFPQTFSAGDEAALDALREAVPEDGDVIDRLIAAAQFRIARRQLQEHYLERLREELPLPLVELPHYFVADVDGDVLGDMADRMTAFGRRVESPVAARVDG